MKVKFEFTAADAADVAQRSSERSKTIREQRLLARTSWAALLSFALFFVIDGPKIMRAIYATFVFFALQFLWQRWFRSSNPSSYLKYYRERLGGDGPFVCEVEITPEGVSARQYGAEIRWPWSNVAEIVDTPGAVEFRCKPVGLLVVRDRAFQTAQERAEFLQAAKNFSG